MSLGNSAYAAALIVAAILSFVAGMEIWQRRQAPGGWALVIMQSGLVIWSLTYALHWLSTGALAHFWLDMTYLGVVVVPTALLIFVLQFTFRGRLLSTRRILLLCAEPALTLLGVITNPFHELFHRVDQLQDVHRYFSGGPIFWVNAIYTYMIVLMVLILLIGAVLRSRFNYRNQALMLLLGVSLPILGTLLTFTGLNPFPDLDLTPIAFSASSLFFAVALNRYHLLRVVPIARYALVEGMSDGVIVLDDQKMIVDLNPAAVRLLAIPADELIGKHLEDAFSAHNEITALCDDERIAHTEVQWSMDPLQWFDLQVTPLRSKQEINGWLMVWRDITELKIARNFLRQSEQRYSYLLETAAFPVVITNLLDNTVMYANQRAAQLFELQGTAIGEHVLDYYQNPADRERLLDLVKENGHVNNFEVGMKNTSGTHLWALVSANSIEYNGCPALFVAINNITERRRLEQEMRNLQRAVEQSESTVVITDLHGDMVYVNPAFTRTSGYEASEVLGNNPRLLKSGFQDPEFYQDMWSTIKQNRSWKGSFRNRRKDGSLYWESATISPITDLEGQTTGYLAVKEDITQRKEYEEKLEKLNVKLKEQLQKNEELSAILREQSIRDPLTNVYNRRYLNETLPREFSRALREQYPISIIMLDIDRFKGFNDTYGHDVGDQVLVALANVLTDGTRGEDLVVRYGGEEFLVILINTPSETAFKRAEALRAAFNQQIIPHEGNSLQSSISAGVASYPRNGATPEAVIRAADQAMYRAKAAGRNCVRE